MNGVIDPGDHQFPYAYVSDHTMTIVAVFKPQGFAQNPNQIQIKGEVIGITPSTEPSSLINISIPTYGPVLKDGNYTIKTTIELPSYTVDIPWFKTIWEYALPNESNWSSAGESSNHLYLTYKPMTFQGKEKVSPTLQTVFQDATSTTPFPDSGSPEDLMEQVIWPHFSSLSATRAIDGQALHYYQDWKTMFLTFPELVDNLDGQCTAWAELLAAAMYADRLDGSDVVTLKMLTARKYNGFFVNNWSFSPEDKLNTNYLSTKTLQGSIVQKGGTYKYQWQPGKAPNAKDMRGVRGQNVTDPASIFYNHVIVEFDTRMVTYYYDPSYGQIYQGSNQAADDRQFQVAAIAGFFIQTEDGNVLRLDITPNQFKQPNSPLIIQDEKL